MHAVACSYAFLGICEAIFRGRDLIFCVEPYIIIYFKDIKSYFNWDNLEPAPGRSAPLCLVLLPSILELDVLEQAPGCQNEKKVQGFFRHKFLSFMKCFQIFLNVNLSTFKKTKF